MFSQTLVDEAKSLYGKETAQAVKSFFNAMALPVPHEKEYHETYGDGFVVFLDDYGLLIRLTNDTKYPLMEHARILQPLMTRKAGELRISLSPGVHLTDDEKAASRLSNTLKKDNINFWDNGAKNIGRLPSLSPKDKKDYVVI